MLKNSMNMGTGSITLQNDPRVTKIGSFLRKTKINELPQIVNILKGVQESKTERVLLSFIGRIFKSKRREIEPENGS